MTCWKCGIAAGMRASMLANGQIEQVCAGCGAVLGASTTSSPVPAVVTPKPAPTVETNLVATIRARLRAIKEELKHMAKLQKEAEQLQRMLREVDRKPTRPAHLKAVKS